MKRYTAQLASGFLTVFAYVFVQPLCTWFFHKPEVPAELLKKQA
ncbi:cyclic lactone autoinducer peptide [Paenibacillus oceani]|uniref:Cyclic lactone autoinducer peptide n=1 Tax=Paenibacillus oceani TaxID=2772510 RepID=A0A927H1A6_9BACL|nr:cyclic lactone autoinducer peptide [Paenibacillus oceani]MBD2864138.1 cyclic lactone autoinducer peptide [Paenibacillus oceani]